MAKINAILFHEVIDVLGAKLVVAANRCGHELQLYDIRDNYLLNAQRCDALITWGVKLHHKYYTDDLGGKPVLFMENALLCQSSGVYMDAKGWFAESSIRDTLPAKWDTGDIRRWRPFVPLAKHVERYFGWELFSDNYDPDGPIMFALQNPRDAAFRFYYDCDRNKPEEGDWGLKYLRENHMDDVVLVRPHPKHINRFWQHQNRLMEEGWGDNWIVDYNENVYSLLKQCSQLISVSSTLITEALTLGIPVTALGRGVFSSVDFSSKGSIRDYLLTIYERQLPYDCTIDNILQHPSWQEFIQCLQVAH